MSAHIRDTHCTLDETDSCVVCGVYHGDPCPACGGRGFHKYLCTESDAYQDDLTLERGTRKNEEDRQEGRA